MHAQVTGVCDEGLQEVVGHPTGCFAGQQGSRSRSGVARQPRHCQQPKQTENSKPRLWGAVETQACTAKSGWGALHCGLAVRPEICRVVRP